jgi:hypothetical protein
MSIHVVIQPLAEYGAEVVSPSPGVRQLVAGSEGATLLVQVPARIGGFSDTARFARSLAAAARMVSRGFVLGGGDSGCDGIPVYGGSGA